MGEEGERSRGRSNIGGRGDGKHGWGRKMREGKEEYGGREKRR